MARTPNTTTAVAPTSLSEADLMALLAQAGLVAQSQSDFHRMSLKSGILETDDGEMFPPRKDGPSVRLRIVTPPVYYNAIFLSDRGDNGSVNAADFGHPEWNGRFCRKYDDPAEQQADTNPANVLYDEIVRQTGGKGSFKGDMEVQIVPANGQMTGEETIYTLTLPTTSIFEWRGSSRQPEAGSVSDDNFIVRLARFAREAAIEAGADEAGQTKAILEAMTALRVGGVIADVYLVKAQDKDKTRDWWVIKFVPIHVEVGSEVPTLGTGESPSDLPF